MLNPSLTNFTVTFGNNFYPDELTKKYNNFLFHKNYPFRTINGLVNESIQSIQIPGISLNIQTVTGLENTGKNPRNVKDKNGNPDFPHTTIQRHYPGTASMNEIYDSNQVVIGFKNYLINYLYFWEILFKYYKRSREVELFPITICMKDSGEVDTIKFSLIDVFISGLPNLLFSYNQSFNDPTLSFDLTCTFNRMDVDFIIPNFNINEIDLIPINNQ